MGKHQATNRATPSLEPVRVWVNVEIDMRATGDYAQAASDVQAQVERAMTERGYRIHSIASAGRPILEQDKRYRTALPNIPAEDRARKFSNLTPLQQAIVMQCGNSPQTLTGIFTPYRGKNTTQQVAHAITGLQADGWLVPVELHQQYASFPSPATKAGLAPLHLSPANGAS